MGINFCRWDTRNCVWAAKQCFKEQWQKCGGVPIKVLYSHIWIFPWPFYPLALKHVFSQYLTLALKKKCVYVAPPLGHRFELFSKYISWCSYLLCNDSPHCEVKICSVCTVLFLNVFNSVNTRWAFNALHNILYSILTFQFSLRLWIIYF